MLSVSKFCVSLLNSEFDWPLILPQGCRIYTRLLFSMDVAKFGDFILKLSFPSCTPPIIHRDLKTPNVLLCSVDPNFNGPLAKVSDFGASAQMFMTSLQSGNIGSSDKVSLLV